MHFLMLLWGSQYVNMGPFQEVFTPQQEAHQNRDVIAVHEVERVEGFIHGQSAGKQATNLQFELDGFDPCSRSLP